MTRLDEEQRAVLQDKVLNKIQAAYTALQFLGMGEHAPAERISGALQDLEALAKWIQNL